MNIVPISVKTNCSAHGYGLISYYHTILQSNFIFYQPTMVE